MQSLLVEKNTDLTLNAVSQRAQSAIVSLRLRFTGGFALRTVSWLEKFVSLYALSGRFDSSSRLKAFMLRISTYLGAEGVDTWMKVHNFAATSSKNFQSWQLISEIEAQVMVDKITRSDQRWRLLAADLIERILSSQEKNVDRTDDLYARLVLRELLWRIPPSNRRTVADEFAKLVRSKQTTPVLPSATKRESELDRNGLVVVGKKLTIAQVSDIHQYLRDKSVKKTHYAEQEPWGQSLSVEEIRRTGSHYASYPRPVVLECPHLLALCNDSAILDSVRSFLGVTPVLDSINLFWTFASPEAGAVSVFHRDQNGFDSVSMYTFLTDVDNESGPHQYVSGSADYEKCKGIVSQSSYSDLEVDQFFLPPWSSALVPSVFRGHITTIDGPAGTVFLTDAYGLHRGVVPSKTDRLLFYAVYSLIPIESSESILDLSC